MILLDSLDDIVYDTDFLVLHTFACIPLPGAWCRFFSSMGNNMIFSSQICTLIHYPP